MTCASYTHRQHGERSAKPGFSPPARLCLRCGSTSRSTTGAIDLRLEDVHETVPQPIEAMLLDDRTPKVRAHAPSDVFVEREQTDYTIRQVG